MRRFEKRKYFPSNRSGEINAASREKILRKTFYVSEVSGELKQSIEKKFSTSLCMLKNSWKVEGKVFMYFFES
jgi:hypothetical protein